MKEKRKKSVSAFRRADSESGSREHAILKKRKKQMVKLKRRKMALFLMAAAAACGLLLVFLAFAGYFEKQAETTTLTLKSDGSLVFEEVTLPEEKTSKREVVSYVKDTIARFNQKKGEKAVRFISCDVSADRMYLKTAYKDADSYADFTGLELVCGSVKEASDEGYLFNNAFVSVSGNKKGKAADKTVVKKDASRQVLILDQPIRVVVPSAILFITRDNTVLESERTVTIEKPTETYILFE